jgi:hypothetical protein
MYLCTELPFGNFLSLPWIYNQAMHSFRPAIKEQVSVDVISFIKMIPRGFKAA